MSLLMAIVIPLRAGCSSVGAWPQMEFNPHFCPAMFWSPQPESNQAKFSGHKTSLVNILPFIVEIYSFWNLQSLDIK